MIAIGDANKSGRRMRIGVFGVNEMHEVRADMDTLLAGSLRADFGL